MIKASFFILTKKGYWVLRNFIEQFGPDFIDLVIIEEDKKIENDYYSEIRKICIDNNIKWFNRKEKYTISGGICFAISWKWIINQSNFKLIILHDSLLPKYRGFAPLVTALINGDKKIGVTALWAEDNYDTGRIICQKEIDVNYPKKIAEVIDDLILVYSSIVIEIFQDLTLKKSLLGIEQNESEATYSLWLDEEDYCINWNQDASKIQRFIDAVGSPYNGASSFIENKKVRIFDAETVADVYIENRSPGKIIFLKEGIPIVVCKSGLLRLKEVVDDKNRNSILPLKKFRIRLS